MCSPVAERLLGIDLERDLMQFLVDRLGADPDQVTLEGELFSTNVLDSFSMVELIAFIEKQAGIKMKPTEVTLDNLDSVAKILNFVAAKSRTD